MSETFVLGPISAAVLGVYSGNYSLVERAFSGFNPPLYKIEGEPISAIVPTHNEENYIGKCLKCLLNQTYFPIETIVVDYASEDRTREIAQRYGAKVIQTDEPGVGNARDLGAEKAAHNFLFFTDADAIFENQLIEKMAKRLEETNADIVTVPAIYYDTVNPFLVIGMNIHKFRAPWLLSARAILIPKQIWAEVGGWEVPIWEERHLGLKLKKAGFKIEMARDLAVATTARRWYRKSRAIRSELLELV